MEMTEALKTYVEKNIEKLRGHFDKVITADVVLTVEKHRHIAEMTLTANGLRIHSKESSPDMYMSVDAVTNKLDKQITKFKTRIQRHKPRESKESRNYLLNIVEIDHSDNGENERAPRHRIVQHEKLPMKPMSIDEAALQLELADDCFMVFSNAETQQVNVIYTREDGTYGLIEPQF